MANLSLRQYFQLNNGKQGIRPCFAGNRVSPLSLRSLLLGPRIIHISDLHFTDSDHTWDVGGPIGIRRDDQDSVRKSNDILSLLCPKEDQKRLGGADIVVITGDLTDSGGEGDYKIAEHFVQRLRNNGYMVFVIPGNHDYCWEGLQVFETIFKSVLNTSEATIAAEILAPGSVAAIISALLINAFPGLVFPPEFIACFVNLFTISIPDLAIRGSTDTVDNKERRQRFITYLTPESCDKYPHIYPIENGYLILLDSMQAELDEQIGDLWAQGAIGRFQLNKLETSLNDLQRERQAGKKVIVCLHHSPFKSTKEVQKGSKPLLESDSTKGLRDYEAFLQIVTNKIDCLLFGHTTPSGQDHQPSISTSDNYNFAAAESQYGIPLINCENLEAMNDSYSVAVLDLGSYQRIVLQTKKGVTPEYSWGTIAN